MTSAQAIQSYASTKKATVHFLGESLFEDKTLNNIAGVMLNFEQEISLEEIFNYCQNQNSDYSIIGTRSMMAGDVIELENGDKYEVAFMGFEKLEA
jgi:hypothetical protein